MIGLGDVVVCIKTPGKGRGPRPEPCPTKGGLYRVLGAKPSESGRWVKLKLRDTAPVGWNARNFRKLEASDEDVFRMAERAREKEDV